MFYSRPLLSIFRRTARLLTISDEYIPRAFTVKSTTGLAGVAVEPLWKPKLLAAAAELQAFLTTSDIPPESTYYNVTMTLVKRINYGVKECQDDWCTLEKKFFWGWPVEYILQVTRDGAEVERVALLGARSGAGEARQSRGPEHRQGGGRLQHAVGAGRPRGL